MIISCRMRQHVGGHNAISQLYNTRFFGFSSDNRNRIHSFIHRSFIHQCLYSPLLGPDLFFSFIISFTQSVGLLGWSPRRKAATYTAQHTHRHPCLEWDSNSRSQCWASDDSSCLRPRGPCYRHRHRVATRNFNLFSGVDGRHSTDSRYRTICLRTGCWGEYLDLRGKK
jgi:hypothetical protein